MDRRWPAASRRHRSWAWPIILHPRTQVAAAVAKCYNSCKFARAQLMATLAAGAPLEAIIYSKYKKQISYMTRPRERPASRYGAGFTGAAAWAAPRSTTYP